jgi:hypothetical protein
VQSKQLSLLTAGVAIVLTVAAAVAAKADAVGPL